MKKRKHIVRKIIASFLIITTLASYASTLSVAGAGGYSGSGGGAHGANGSWGANYPQTALQQGVRVTIVDKHGNNMLDTATGYTAIDLVFSRIPDNALSFNGNKFESETYSNGKSFAITVQKLNEVLNNVVDNNPFYDDGNGGKKVKSYPLPEYSEPYNYGQYSGLPKAVVWNNSIGGFDGSGGKAVKEFFIKGKQSSFKTITWRPTLNNPQVPNYSGSSSGNTSSNNGNSSGNSSSSGNTSGSNASKINTPYGNITKEELDKHREEVESAGPETWKMNITSDEKTNMKAKADQFLSHAKSLIYNYILDTMNRISMMDETNPSTQTNNIYEKSLKQMVKDYKVAPSSATGEYNAGKITWEYVKYLNWLLDSEVQALIKGYINKITTIAATADSKSNQIKQLEELLNSIDSRQVYVGLQNNIDVYIENNPIPLALPSTTTNKQISSYNNEAANQIYKKINTKVGSKDIADISDSEASSIISSLNLKSIFDNNTQLFLSKLGDTDKSRLETLLNMAIAEIADLIKETKDSIDNANAAIKEDGSLDGLDITISDGKSQLGENNTSNQDEICTVEKAQAYINQLVAEANIAGYVQYNYDYFLNTGNGNTDDEKLQDIANKITQVGIEAWLNSLTFSQQATFDNNMNMFGYEGWIEALLDIKYKTGGYVFNILLGDKEKEYTDAKDNSSNQEDTPSKRYVFCEYGIVLEPVYWFYPTTTVKASDNSPCKYEGSTQVFVRNRPFYGTPTNFVKWTQTESGKPYAREVGHTNLHGVMATSMYIDEEIDYFEDFKVPGISLSGGNDLSKFKSTADILARTKETDRNKPDFSYGWHFAGPDISNSSLTGTVTWRTGENSPGKAPDPTPLPDPSIDSTGAKVVTDDYPNGIPAKKFTIVKYYETRDYSQDPNNPDITREGPTIRPDNPNRITIVDEPDYKVEDWFTGKGNDLPNENDDTEEYYNQKVDDPPINQSTPTTVNTTIELDKDNKVESDPDNAEKTLYVLLVKEIKNNTPQLPTGTGDIEIKESQVTKAVHTNSKIVKSAPWGNYSFDFSIGDFTKSHIYYDGCGGRYRRCPGHICSYGMPGGHGDAQLQIVFKGLHSISFGSQPEIGFGKHSELEPKVYEKGGVFPETLTSLDKTIFNYSSDGQTANGVEYVSVLWRYCDIPTLAKYKQADITNTYGATHYDIPAKILPQDIVSKNQRIGAPLTTSSINFTFGVDQGTSDLEATASCHEYCGSSHRDTQSLTATVWEFNFPSTVLIWTYKGKTKPLAQEPFEKFTGTTKKISKAYGNHLEFTTVQDQQEIRFYPYIKMTYQTNELDKIVAEENGSSTANTRYDTYVLSEEKSRILPSDAIDVGWSNPNEGGSMNLLSQQWSLHQKAVKGSDGWQGANQVLPGGAIYQLDTGRSETNVKIVTYQTVVDGKTRQYLSDALTGDEYTEAQVKKEHNDFITTAKDVLDNLRIVQWVNNNVNSTTAWPAGWDENTAGSVVVRGGNEDLSALNMSGVTMSKTNTEDKYYMKQAEFKGGSAKASEGDLDIISEEELVTVYKVFSDTKGNIYLVKYEAQQDLKTGATDQILNGINNLKDFNADTMNKNTMFKAELLVNKTVKWQDVNGKLTGDAKLIDDRTSIITNVVKSIERNTGSDKTAAWATNDGKWYNEAFDGIYLVRQATTLRIGLADPSKRSAALDPALCPTNIGQSDLYTKAFLSQFCMNDKSDAAVAQGKDSQYLGTFKGHDIKLPDMQGLYQSRKFYIPNANVQDLN